MSLSAPKRPPFAWTVARMLKVLASGARRGASRLSLDEIQRRYGIGTRELLELARRMASTEDCSPAGQLPLQLFLDEDEGSGRRLIVQGAEPLSRLANLSKADAVLVADVLEHLAVEPDTGSFCLGLAARLRQAAGKVQEEAGFYYHPSDPPFLRSKVALAKEGLDQGRTLAFEYRGRGSRSAGRVADPLSLRRDNGVWRLMGWDHHRAATRTFALEYMAKIVVTENAFEWPSGLTREEALSRDLSVYQPTGQELEVRLKVSARLAEDWGKTFKKMAKPDREGWRRVLLLTASPDWVVRTFLPRVDEVKVLGPEEVQRKWREAILELVERNRERLENKR